MGMAKRDPKNEIGPYLARARKNAGYIQPEAAPLLGYESKSGVSALETGTNEATADVLCKMADLYGCTLDYLLGREDKMRPDFQGITREHTDLLRDFAQLPDEIQEHIAELIRALSGQLRGDRLVEELLSMDPRGWSYDQYVSRVEQAQADHRKTRRK